MKQKQSNVFPEWRVKILERCDLLLMMLTILELILSVVFLSLSYLNGNMYFKGVGIGLSIAWVTSMVVYIYSEWDLHIPLQAAESR